MSKRKRLVVLLLLLLYAALVWTVCWLVQDFTWIYAVLLTVCGVTVAAVYWLVSRLSSQATSPAAPATAAAKVEVPASDPDFQAVQALLSEANVKLGKSALLASERVRSTVSDLPVYVIAGTEGSGKTTTFLQAGLAPEALAGQVYRGTAVIPTQVANFWFAKGALVAEASGRFFSDDSGRWARFLAALRGKTSGSMLRKVWGGATPRNNLRGIVLFVDSNQFVGIPDASRLPALARATQERLRLASEMFAADTPVWVVFSKADSIPFFRDYFTRLRDNEDQQPLGCTLDLITGAQRPAAELYAEAETQRLGAAFNTLYQSLAHHRLTLLARESDSGRKPGVYEFPRELKRVRGVMIQFLVDAFRPNPLQPGPLLRGFYFTGKRPVPARSAGEGIPLDRSVIANVSDATSLLKAEEVKAEFERAMARGGAAAPPAEPMVDRWCFVSQLFHEVVRTGPAPVHRYGDRRFDLYRRLAFGGIICACALLALGVLYSTWNNRQLLSEVEDAAIKISNAPLDDRELKPEHLDDLDKLRARLVDLNDYDRRVPWRLGFLLYRGDDVAGSARSVYFSYFNKYMLEPVAKRLAAEMAGLPMALSDAFPYDRIYNDLKMYLTISQTCPADPPLSQALLEAWRSNRINSEGQKQLALNQFTFYVDELQHKRVKAWDEQQEAVKLGRGYLSKFDQTEGVYRHLVEQVNQSASTVRVADYAPKYSEVLSGARDMAGAFTPTGWKDMQERIRNAKSNEGSCVLGASFDQRAMSVLEKSAFPDKLRGLYARDYVRQWKDMLAGVKLLPYHDRKGAVERLKALDEDSSLLGLLFMARENAEVEPPSITGAGASKAVEAAKKEAAVLADRSRVGQGVKRVGADITAVGGQPAGPLFDANAAFQPLRTLFTKEARRENPNDLNNPNYTRAVSDLRKAMKALADSGSPEADAAVNGDAKKAVDAGSETVLEMAHKFYHGTEDIGDEVKRLLNEPFRLADCCYDKVPGRATAERLNRAGAALCKELNPLLQKYPFKGAATDEAKLGEVESIFSPQVGSLYKLRQDLSKFLVESNGRYVQRTDVPTDVKIDKGFMDAFSHLMQVSKALFADDSVKPSMRYRLNILNNPDVSSIALTIDGDKAGEGSHQFTWPGLASQNLTLSVFIGDAEFQRPYKGPWAIFTMIADAGGRPLAGRDIALSKFSGGLHAVPAPIIVKGKEITVHIRIEDFPGGVENAFDRGFFEQCRCAQRVAAQ